jgi:hypothetical protein
MLNTMTGIEKLLKAANGSPTKIAQQLDSPGRPCKRQHVEYWVEQGYVPGSWAPTVTQKFGIPLHELNPKIYPKPTHAA